MQEQIREILRNRNCGPHDLVHMRGFNSQETLVLGRYFQDLCFKGQLGLGDIASFKMNNRIL